MSAEGPDNRTGEWGSKERSDVIPLIRLCLTSLFSKYTCSNRCDECRWSCYASFMSCIIHSLTPPHCLNIHTPASVAKKHRMKHTSAQYHLCLAFWPCWSQTFTAYKQSYAGVSVSQKLHCILFYYVYFLQIRKMWKKTWSVIRTGHHLSLTLGLTETLSRVNGQMKKNKKK